MGGGDDECEEATHAPHDLFMGGQGHDQVDHFCKVSATGFVASARARQSSGIAEGGSVAPMGAVADVSKGMLPAPEGRQ